MLQGLKTAIKKQKKLILLFLLTVFIPSAALSIFGLIALRNERYRIEKQVEEDQSRLADEFKSQVRSRFTEVENMLKFLVIAPSLMDSNYPVIEEALNGQSAINPLLEQFFIVYGNSDPWFPPVDFGYNYHRRDVLSVLNDDQQKRIREAEKNEYVLNNYPNAISLYKTLFETIKDDNYRAQFLNHIARNQTELNEIDQAIGTYQKIISDYPETTTASGIPLSISARLELIKCYRKTNNTAAAIQGALDVLSDITKNWVDFSFDQFSAYILSAQEEFNTLTVALPPGSPDKGKYESKFRELDIERQNILEKWQVINNLKTECLPDIKRELQTQDTITGNISHYLKTIGKDDYLILYSIIPGKNLDRNEGILGIKINSTYLEKKLIDEIVTNIGSGQEYQVSIININNRNIYGNPLETSNLNKTTSFFENNFPPWKIEIINAEKSGTPLSAIYKSFYFWTIITLILILVFGVMMIGRIMTHEMQVIKIKSDFVSTVSHEFKTPITSIKGLTERLLEGKVKDPERMKEYFAVIARDTDNLSRLVSNFLDFAKIEQGKDQYDFIETDIKEWLEAATGDFRNDCIRKGYIFSIEIPDDIPPLLIDQRHMSLVINNLIVNAVKFSAGNIEIKITAEKIENNILIKVKDSGIGIPKAELQKIFEKFYRGQNPTSLSVTGTGLGLTLIKHIVEAHGGTIGVESEPGKGSTFILTFPVKKQ